MRPQSIYDNKPCLTVLPSADLSPFTDRNGLINIHIHSLTTRAYTHIYIHTYIHT